MTSYPEGSFGSWWVFFVVTWERKPSRRSSRGRQKKRSSSSPWNYAALLSSRLQCKRTWLCHRSAGAGFRKYPFIQTHGSTSGRGASVCRSFRAEGGVCFDAPITLLWSESSIPLSTVAKRLIRVRKQAHTC